MDREWGELLLATIAAAPMLIAFAVQCVCLILLG